jgi:hypothetical protein
MMPSASSQLGFTPLGNETVVLHVAGIGLSVIHV